MYASIEFISPISKQNKFIKCQETRYFTHIFPSWINFSVFHRSKMSLTSLLCHRKTRIIETRPVRTFLVFSLHTIASGLVKKKKLGRDNYFESMPDSLTLSHTHFPLCKSPLYFVPCFQTCVCCHSSCYSTFRSNPLGFAAETASNQHREAELTSKWHSASSFIAVWICKLSMGPDSSWFSPSCFSVNLSIGLQWKHPGPVQ